jgi:tetratricopeptide (TPR) repeat protein
MAQEQSATATCFHRGLLLLLVLSPLLLAGSLTAPFLDFDDVEHVAAPVVLGIKPWYSVFQTTSGSIFPLTILSFKFERMFFLNTLGIQNWAPFSRIDNLLLHALSGFLVWQIFRAFKFSTSWLMLITGAFLLHPMACESVCWVSERKNVLAAAFGFGAIAVSLWNWGPRRWFYIAALYVLALLSKPSALGLLPTLLALQFPAVQHALGIRSRDSTSGKSPSLTARAGLCVLLVLAALGSVSFNLHSHSQMIMKPPGGSVFTALLTDAEVFRRYLMNLLMPVELSAAYAVKPILTPIDPRFLANAGLVAAFIAATLWSSKRRALSAFLWFWFFAGLGPVMNLVATMLLMQDRYVYLSSPALFGVVALALEGLLSRFKTGMTELPQIAVFGVLAILLAGAFARSFVWQTTYTLYRDATEKQPLSAFAHYNFALSLIKGADQLVKSGDDAQIVDAMRVDAADHLQTACSLDDMERLASPGKPYTALAIVQFERGRFDEAEATCRRVLQDNFKNPITFPNKIEVHLWLAKIQTKRQRYLDALAEVQEAITIGTRNDYQPPDAWLLAGQSLEALNKPDDAIAAYEKVEQGSGEYDTAQSRLSELKKSR